MFAFHPTFNNCKILVAESPGPFLFFCASRLLFLRSFSLLSSSLSHPISTLSLSLSTYIYQFLSMYLSLSHLSLSIFFSLSLSLSTSPSLSINLFLSHSSLSTSLYHLALSLSLSLSLSTCSLSHSSLLTFLYQLGSITFISINFFLSTCRLARCALALPALDWLVGPRALWTSLRLLPLWTDWLCFGRRGCSVWQACRFVRLCAKASV